MIVVQPQKLPFRAKAPDPVELTEFDCIVLRSLHQDGHVGYDEFIKSTWPASPDNVAASLDKLWRCGWALKGVRGDVWAWLEPNRANLAECAERFPCDGYDEHVAKYDQALLIAEEAERRLMP